MINGKKILVIGDVIIDIYYIGDVNRISPEAPVPVFKKKGERYVLGGAANVAANITATGQQVSVLSRIGEDEFGIKVRELFRVSGIDDSYLKNLCNDTITKTRLMAENNQQLIRIDVEDTTDISLDETNKLTEILSNIIDDYDVVVISDYNKGLLTYDFTQNIINISNQKGIKVLVDVKGNDYSKYHGAWLLKPNVKELADLTGMPVGTHEERINAAYELRKNVESTYILTTCGSKGMFIVGDGMTKNIGTTGRAVYDVTGAGDTVIAYLAVGIANGMDIVDAMSMANYAAGIQVGRVGTSVVYMHEVEKAMSGTRDEQNKVFEYSDRDELIELVKSWKAQGETIVSTNGCFDIVHRGHISLLENAKSYGSKLVVFINSDASVKRLKGDSRPINSENDRAFVIAALNCVDAVVIFDPMEDERILTDEDSNSFTDEQKRIAKESPIGIMKLIAPDIHVKGGDYTKEQVPEAIFAKEFKSVPYINGYSTTETISKSMGK